MTVDQAAVYIRNNVDIVEVISRYVTLRKVGRNYFGLCPFHSEKTPSFSVNPSKGIFKCFGCGEGGDVIKFISKMENISYRDAVLRLASEIGISVEESPETQILFKVLEEARKMFSAALFTRAGSRALEYLHSRGMKDESINLFGVGYDPTDDFVQRALSRRGYKPEDLKNAGLVNAAGRDFFARRILFPIDNLGRRTIGFGGRTLEKENPLKYLNTGETRIFKKSRVLFGWTQAVNAIDRSKSVVLVEGYFDAVILNQEGFSNTVALLGTAVTLEQAQLLSRKVRRATLLLDPDDAGVMAALKGCFSLLAQNIEPSVAILPEGVDPDEMALKSRSGLNELLSSPLDMLAFLSTVADRFFKGMRSPEFLDALAQNLRGLPTSPLMEMALREIAESMGVEARTLQAFLSSKSGQSQGNNAQTLSPTRPRLNDVENIEELIAKLLVNTPELSSVVSMDEYFYPYTPGLKEVLDTIGRWDPEVHNEQNYIELFPDYMREFVEESITEDFGNYEQKEKMLKELIARWKIKDLDNFIKKLKEQIAASPNDSLLQQLQEVLQEREEINRRLQGLD